MSKRFGRDYEVEITIGGFTHFIKPPIRIQYDCIKSLGSSTNKMTIKIFNLVPEKRDALVKDAEDRNYIPFIFKAGYEGSLEVLFKGSAHTAKSERAGVDYITTIESIDGGFDFLNSFTSKTVKGKDTAVTEILGDMKNTRPGKITKQNKLIRPKVIVGNSVKMIEEQLNDGESYMIDEEKLYIIKDTEYIGTYIPVVNASTGLTNAPTRQERKATFTTLTNPTLKVGGLCELESTTAKHLNGIYKIETIQYKGDNYGNDWNQTVIGYLNEGFTKL